MQLPVATIIILVVQSTSAMATTAVPKASTPDSLSQPTPVVAESNQAATQSLSEAKRAYQAHMLAEQYQEAVDAARVSVLIAKMQASDSFELGLVHNQFGNALLKTDRPGEALEQFKISHELLKNHAGLFSKALLQPLMGQGYARQRLGEHESALDEFRRGQHIVHRNDGVLGLDQIPAIEAQAKSFAAIGEWKRSSETKLLIHKIYRQKYGDTDPRITPGLFALAQWHATQHRPRKALEVYDHIISLNPLDTQPTPDAVIEALRGQVREYGKLPRRSALPQAIVSQQTILKLVRRDNNLKEQIEAHLALGDLHLRQDSESSAWRHYNSALALTQADDETNWASLFQQPILIDPGPRIVDLIAEQSDARPYYEFRTTILANGKPRNVGVLETNASRQTYRFAVELFRLARFRPRIDHNGLPIATEDFQFRRVY